MNKVREVPTFFMFFPFPFLQERMAPTPSAPPGELNGTEEEDFFDEKLKIEINDQNSQQESSQQNSLPEWLSSPIHTSVNDNDINQADQETQYENIQKTKEEIIEGSKRVWEPSKRPWILEDTEEGHKAVLWNTNAPNVEEVKTVGIMLSIDENDQLQWINKTDFRMNYANIIIQNENDVRTLYYILNIILDEVGEEVLIETFADTINITPECWFHWRVVPENLAITPFLNISEFIDRNKTLKTAFDTLHESVLEFMTGVLERGESTMERSKQELQEMIDKIASECEETTSKIENETRQIIEYNSNVMSENKRAIVEGLNQIQLYKNEVNEAKSQLIQYSNEVKQTIDNMLSEAISQRKEQEYASFSLGFTKNYFCSHNGNEFCAYDECEWRIIIPEDRELNGIAVPWFWSEEKYKEWKKSRQNTFLDWDYRLKLPDEYITDIIVPSKNDLTRLSNILKLNGQDSLKNKIRIIKT